jgi:crotonobetainyl-CoA:carnitine CoA-transferase CaiB-like acyl-CoA transferase
VIASYKPGDAEKLKVDYKTLSALNPKLIYGQTTGYGSDNPRVGYDAVVQAEAGFMFMNGEPGGASLKMPVALVDILAAHHLKEGLLLALLQRERTGKGDFVEVSLIQAAVSSLANQATNWLIAGKMPQKKGSAHPNIAPYGDVFRTSDNKEILLAVGSDRQFQDLCKLLDLSSIALTKEYQTNQSRVENRLSLNQLLQEKISRWTAIDLIDSINKVKVPGGIIQNMQEVFQMPEVIELLIKGEHFSGVRTFAANSPSWKSETLLPPPHFGEHTDEILTLL